MGRQWGAHLVRLGSSLRPRDELLNTRNAGVVCQQSRAANTCRGWRCRALCRQLDAARHATAIAGGTVALAGASARGGAAAQGNRRSHAGAAPREADAALSPADLLHRQPAATHAVRLQRQAVPMLLRSEWVVQRDPDGVLCEHGEEDKGVGAVLRPVWRRRLCVGAYNAQSDLRRAGCPEDREHIRLLGAAESTESAAAADHGAGAADVLEGHPMVRVVLFISV